MKQYDEAGQAGRARPGHADRLPRTSAWCRLLGLSACLGLAACAGSGAFSQGQALLAQGQIEPGLAQLEQAARQAPDNTRYQTTLALQRAAALGRLLEQAGQARARGQWDLAQATWQRVQALDPDNAAARQGLAWLDGQAQRQQWLAQAAAMLERADASQAGELASVADLLTLVARDEPQHPEVARLRARLEQLRAQQRQARPRLGEGYRKPVSLMFQDAPLRSVLEVMSRESGINFYYDRDVRPDLRVTVMARDASVEDALRLVLATNQLGYKALNENSILVYPETAQKILDYQDLSVRSFYVTNADVKAVANTLKTIVKTRDLIVDERLGILFMRDTPEAISLAERIVALQDLDDPEVMLEVEILEVRRNRLENLGVQWPSSLSLSPLQRQGVPLTLRELGNITSATTEARIGALGVNLQKRDEDVNLLANPRIRVRNKERAKIQIGDRLPIMTTTAGSTGFVSESVSYIDVGLKLEVEPTVHMDNEVAIRINLEVSSQGNPVVSKSGTTAYQIGTRSANTMLRLRDGETQILAGLIQNSDRNTANKVPWLGDIPLLGRLFGSQRDDNERTEILLSITPRIVRAPTRPSLAQSVFASGTESRVGAEPLMLAQAATPSLPSPPTAIAPASQAAPLVTTTPAPPPAPKRSAVSPAGIGFGWQATTQEVKVGQKVSLTLRVDGARELRDVDARIDFDPAVFEVVAVHEGDFFSRGRAPTRFVHRVSSQHGQLFLQVERPDESGQHGLASGAGDVAVVTLRARRAANASKVSLSAARIESAQHKDAAPALPMSIELAVQP